MCAHYLKITERFLYRRHRLQATDTEEIHYHSVHSLRDLKYNDIPEDIKHCNTNFDGDKLKENFSYFFVHEWKSSMPKFVEYWVPVRLSNVQTEQYCASLFSNSMLLCSGLKSDSAHALQEILISTMKCCDHPYLVDRSLRNSVVEDIPVAEQLNAEIELSGKLNLLHKILLEIKKQALRVLILFQSLVGPGMISIGDILDDVIHEKFGEDSYVRIGVGMSRNRKRAALNMFNDKGSSRFICLMETRACIPSIKLSSIDTVILLNSYWDPMNDLSALHKINLTSSHEQLQIFRIYSSCTVEEKILIFAKQGMNLEGNIKNIKQSTCHGLLTWGASNLFQKLHEFHDIDSHSSISSGETFIEDVCHELINLLPNGGQSNDSTNCSFILKVQETGGIYPRNTSLIGEVEPSFIMDCSIIKDMIDNEPHVFWINLLNGKNPRWKYLSSPSSRAVKKGKRLNDLLEELEEQEKSNKKCRKEARSTANQRCPAGLKPRAKKKLRPRYKNRKLSVSQHPCNSSVEHSVTDEPLQPSSNIPLDMTGVGSEPIVTNLGTNNTSLIFGSNDPPEANRLAHSEAQQSVCFSLQRELERLQKDKDENIKLHNDMKLRLKLSLEEEIDQISRNYDLLLQIAETEFVEKKVTLEMGYNKVYMNKVLAETMMQNQDVTDATYSQEMPNVTMNSLMDEVYQVILQQIGPMTVTGSEHRPGNLPMTSSPSFSIIQASNQASASSRIVSRPDEPSLSPCMTVTQPVTSAAVNCMSSVQQIPGAMDQAPTIQTLASHHKAIQQFPTFTEVANYSSTFQQTSGMIPKPEMSSDSLSIIVSAPVTQALHGLTQTLTGHSTNENAISVNSPHMISTSSVQLPRTSHGLLTPGNTFSDLNFPLSGNLAAGYELRAPAPHLRSMRPISISGPNLLSFPSTGVNFPPPISQSGEMQQVLKSVDSVPAIPPGKQFLFSDVSYTSFPYFWDLDRVKF